MTPEQYIKAQLAARCHREAAHLGGTQNMLAVALMLRNRKEAGWLNGDWMQLLEHWDDYAATTYPPAAVDLRDLNFRLVLQQIDDVYNGLALDHLTEGALFCAELHRVDNEWFRAHITRKVDEHPMVAQVGQVHFFR